MYRQVSRTRGKTLSPHLWSRAKGWRLVCRPERRLDGAVHRADHDVPGGTERRHVRHDVSGVGLAAEDARAHGSGDTGLPVTAAGDVIR